MRTVSTVPEAGALARCRAVPIPARARETALAVALLRRADVRLPTLTEPIEVFAPDGTYLAQWGSLGPGPGQFVEPLGIVVRGGTAYVGDAGTGRISKFKLLPPHTSSEEWVRIAAASMAEAEWQKRPSASHRKDDHAYVASPPW
jgi:hypothetical protein